MHLRDESFRFWNLHVRGYFSAFLYAGIILFIGYSSVWQGLSHYYSDTAFLTGSDNDAVSAIYYQPENPDAHKTRGVIFLRNGEYAAAAAAFEQAIAFRENDFLLWLRLGYSRYQLKDFDGAEPAYKKALLLAPNYSQPNYYMGSMLLETGRSEEGFLFLSRAAEYDSDLYPEILHLARITFPDDPGNIENSLQPRSVETKKIVGRYLIKYNFMTDSLRSFLVGDELNTYEKNEFVKYLIDKQNFPIAREVWLSRLKSENIDVNADEPIYDGGFESITESDASGLGWQIDQKVSAIAVARDDKTFHSGSNALQIKFAGNVEIGRKIISQMAYLKPRSKYRLKFFFHSPEMISAGQPVIIVSDGISDAILGRSALMQATDGKWIESTIDFNTGESSIYNISLQRAGCATSPCPIFGELSLDDFALTEN